MLIQKYVYVWNTFFFIKEQTGMVEHVEISGEKILRYFDIRKWSQKEKEKR
jgi:hypothetical protein